MQGESMSAVNFWNSVVTVASSGGFAWLVYFAVKKFITSYLGGYLPEKGKNLAAKEDLPNITDLVKEVEHKYNVLIKQMEAKQQLRMAAVDARLKAHQEAYTMWRKLMDPSDKDLENGPMPLQCQNWLDHNCLYLEPEVREAFATAYHSHILHSELLAQRADAEQVKAAWDRFMNFHEVLFESIKLPGLTQSEQDFVKN